MPGDADGSGAACVATPPSHYACAHGQRMRAWHLLAGSPSLSGLSCQQIQQARISTGVTRQTAQRVRTLLHRRVASAAAQGVCVSHSAGLAGTSAGSSVQQRTPGGMWPLLCCQICHVCCVPSRSRQVCAFVSAPARRPVWARLGLWLCPTSNVAQRYRGNRDDA